MSAEFLLRSNFARSFIKAFDIAGKTIVNLSFAIAIFVTGANHLIGSNTAFANKFSNNFMKVAILHFAAPPIIGGVESVMGHHARLLVERGHQVLAVKDQLPFALENRVADADLAQLGVLHLLREVLADRVNRVADEDRGNDAEAIIAVGQRVQAVRCGKAQTV